jgi:hypothetical protein
MYFGEMLEEKPLDMRQFDPMSIVKEAQEYLRTLTDERQRLVTQNFIDHARAEATGDYDALMATCSTRRQSYTAWGAGADYSAHLPQDYQSLAQHYQGLIAANIYLIHLEVEKLFAGQDELVVEGIVHQLHSGEMLAAVHGIDMEDPQGVYQLTKRTCIFFVFDEDGLGAGEHAYSNGPATRDSVEKVPTELVPPAFWHNPLTSIA